MKKDMKYVAELLSNRSATIKKVAKSIRKENLSGYDEVLHNALVSEIKKAKSWETQTELLYTIAFTECVDEVPYLKELIKNDFTEFPVVYRALSFAIVYLQNVKNKSDLSSFYEFLESDDVMLAAGACAAIYMLKLPLESYDIEKILIYVMKPKYLENMGKISNPIFFILGLAYLWSDEYKEKIINECRVLNNNIVNQIILNVKKGKPSNINLF